MNLFKTALLAIIAIAFIHDPTYATTVATPFVGTSVFATTNVQPAMVVDDCPFSYTAPVVPDCPNGHPRDLDCFLQCQINYAADMDDFLNTICQFYSLFLEVYNNRVQTALDQYAKCINEGGIPSICRDICNASLDSALSDFTDAINLLQTQLAIHKAAADYTYLDCALGCCYN